MNFDLSPSQKKTFEDFLGLGLEIDKLSQRPNNHFSQEAWTKIFSSSLPKFFESPEKLEKSAIDLAIALEGLGQGCRDNGLHVSLNAHLWGGVLPVLMFGTEVQRESYLDHLVSGQAVAALAMTESEISSDVSAVKSSARIEASGELSLSGHKRLITNVGFAHLYFVYAKIESDGTPSCIIVPSATDGISIQRKREIMGLRSMPFGDIIFSECRVPQDHVVGSRKLGPSIFIHSMTWERTMIMAHAVGAMSRITAKALHRVRKSSRGLATHVQERIAEMKILLETSRLLLYRAAYAISTGKHAIAEASLCKLHVSESYIRLIEIAMELHGGEGYLSETKIEHELRDAFASRFYSGSQAAQRKVITDLAYDPH